MRNSLHVSHVNFHKFRGSYCYHLFLDLKIKKIRYKVGFLMHDSTVVSNVTSACPSFLEKKVSLPGCSKRLLGFTLDQL